MPVKIRLARAGRKKLSCYRIVAADSRARRDGRFLETLGTYNPQSNPKEFTLKVERIVHWLGQGAVPTVTVKNLLKQDGISGKIEALGKGIAPEAAGIERKGERKRKPKKSAGKTAA